MPPEPSPTSSRDGNPKGAAGKPLKPTPGRQSPSAQSIQANQSSRAQAEQAALELLLKIEEQAREISNLGDLQHFIVNQTRKINRARQSFLFTLPRSGQPKMVSVSGVSSIDPTSMLITEARRLLQALGDKHGLASPLDFTLPAFCEPESDLAESYPFRDMAWVPFLTRAGTPFAGLLMARETPWGAADLAISKRLCNAYAHAWRELQPVSRHDRSQFDHRHLRFAAAAAVVLALALPLPMTALAPVEIVATGATIVASPMDGVVESVEVDPNMPVKAGDVLVRFTDTLLRNRREIALRELAVAQSRLRQASLLAFSDAKGRHELAIAESELELKRAELAYATDMLEKSLLRATRDGIAVYADRKALVGKPVVTGERLIEIADPQQVEARIDVAVADVIALKQHGAATLFFDIDPLRPLGARISRADYKARLSDGDLLSFRAYAQLNVDSRVPPRIGLRGTAQIRGDKAPAGLVLFRRPISAARQWLGL
jgi:hypothetical protein